MKTYALILAAIVVAIGLGSCDRRPDIVGQWQSSPLQVTSAGNTSATAVINMDFTKDSVVQLTSLVSFAEALPERLDLDSPYQVSIAATASVSGRWQFVESDDDEIAIMLDYSTFKAEVDPEAVQLTVNATGVQESKIDSIKPHIVDMYRNILTAAMQQQFSDFTFLDDVKVKRPLLTFEARNNDYTFRAVK